MSPYEAINQVRIKLDTFNAVIPFKAHTGKNADAGFDVIATDCNYDVRTDSYVYSTGIHLQMPENFCAFAVPRSSSYKTECYMPGSIGIIDNGYRGEIKFIYKARTSTVIIYKINAIIDKLPCSTLKFRTPKPPFEIGDKIGQLIFIPIPYIHFIQVDELDETDRGNGGFGSTGK